MTKSAYLNELEDKLNTLNRSERKKFISYYEEIIEDYIENGCSEELALERVGSPQSIATDLLRQENGINKNFKSTTKVWIAILLILGLPLWGSLLLAGILLILSAYIIIWCLPFIMGAISFSSFIIAMVSVMGGFILLIQNPALAIVQYGLGIASLGIAMLSAMGTYYFSKKFIGVTKKFTKHIAAFFKSMLKNGREELK
ncbi:MAG: DUF1700 domain-containing protein [Velocimicrobium sp.]